MGYPIINDVTTTVLAPPRFPRGKIPDYPQDFAPKQVAAYPDLAPKCLPLNSDEAFAKVRAAAEAMGWRIVTVDASAKRLVAVAVTRVLRFRDDIVVEVRVPAATGAGKASEVHVRSRSRLGKGDFGANAKRIREYLAKI